MSNSFSRCKIFRASYFDLNGVWGGSSIPLNFSTSSCIARSTRARSSGKLKLASSSLTGSCVRGAGFEEPASCGAGVDDAICWSAVMRIADPPVVELSHAGAYPNTENASHSANFLLSHLNSQSHEGQFGEWKRWRRVWFHENNDKVQRNIKCSEMRETTRS